MANNLDLDIQNNKDILNFTVGNRYSHKTSLERDDCLRVNNICFMHLSSHSSNQSASQKLLCAKIENDEKN